MVLLWVSTDSSTGATRDRAILARMSRAFVKEDASGDQPILVPPRAPLPPDVPNYVTPRGLELLRAELIELDAERARVLTDRDDSERKRRLALLSGRQNQLAARIAGARLVSPEEAPSEVRFGVTVTIRWLSGPNEGRDRSFQIVGVDEATPSQGRIGFVAPLAVAVLGLRVGDVAALRTGRGEEELEVLKIDYREPSGWSPS